MGAGKGEVYVKLKGLKWDTELGLDGELVVSFCAVPLQFQPLV